MNLGTGALSGATGAAFLVGDGGPTANSGVTVAITYSGSIASGTGRAVDIEDRAAGAGAITLSGNITHNNGQAGIFLDQDAAGTITFPASRSTSAPVRATAST